MQALEPAASCFLAVLSNRSRVAAWACRHNTEVFYGGMAALDLYFLSYYDGSFSENFYGLHRLRALDKKPLTRREKLVSLAFTLGVPYLKAKIDDWLEDERMSPAARGPRRSLKSTLLALFSSLVDGSSFLLQLLYLYRRSLYFSPLLALPRVRLCRLSPEQLALHDSISATSRESLLARFPRAAFLWRILFLAADAARFSLPVSVFAYRFAEWWQLEGGEAIRSAQPSQQQQQQGPPVPPPPPVRPLAIRNVPEDPRLCPVCEKERTNPAVSTSGYCFCYPCLYKHVRDHGLCPVTGQPCQLDQITKIY